MKWSFSKAARRDKGRFSLHPAISALLMWVSQPKDWGRMCGRGVCYWEGAKPSLSLRHPLCTIAIQKGAWPKETALHLKTPRGTVSHMGYIFTPQMYESWVGVALVSGGSMDPIAHTCLERCQLCSAGELPSQWHKIFQTVVTLIAACVYVHLHICMAYIWHKSDLKLISPSAHSVSLLGG